MRYDIIYSFKARANIRRLKANARAVVRGAIEEHLRYEPKKVSKSRIKQMRDIASPHYRLRVDDVRIYYDVDSDTVIIHAILLKSESQDWLKEVEGTK
jgi:mRNA-degrading endonuclease RelE of RelBE toxin-antitoxin system